MHVCVKQMGDTVTDCDSMRAWRDTERERERVGYLWLEAAATRKEGERDIETSVREQCSFGTNRCTGLLACNHLSCGGAPLLSGRLEARSLMRWCFVDRQLDLWWTKTCTRPSIDRSCLHRAQTDGAVDEFIRGPVLMKYLWGLWLSLYSIIDWYYWLTDWMTRS